MKVKTTSCCRLFKIFVQKADFFFRSTTDFVKLFELPKMQHLTVHPYTRKKKTKRKEKVGEGGGIFFGKKCVKAVFDSFGRLSIFYPIFIDCHQREHYSKFSIK